MSNSFQKHLSTFKQINTNLTGVFCLVRCGSLSWREEFHLRMLDSDQKSPSKIPTELPSNVEAYSCEDEDTQPVAWINLAQLKECREENFASYNRLKTEPVSLIHRRRTIPTTMNHCQVEISAHIHHDEAYCEVLLNHEKFQPPYAGKYPKRIVTRHTPRGHSTST